MYWSLWVHLAYIFSGVALLLMYGLYNELYISYRHQSFLNMWVLFNAVLWGTLGPLMEVGSQAHHYPETWLCFAGGYLYFNPSLLDMSILVILFSSMISCFVKAGTHFETWLLWLLIICGFMLILMSNDLIVFYLALELQNLCFYILVSLPKTSSFSTEAGVKYSLLGSMASAIFLLGCVFLYGYSGDSSLYTLMNLSLMPQTDSSLLILGIILISATLFFKLALVPFHTWAPDVYQGASLGVTAFLSTLPKLVYFYLVATIYAKILMGLWPEWQSYFLWVALISVAVGSLAGLNQSRIKRLLAYSTISHSGFILLTVALGSLQSLLSMFSYLLIYLINSSHIFSILNATRNKRTQESFPFIVQFIGLASYMPTLTVCLAISFLSLAGIPPLAGFFSKWIMLATTLLTNSWLPLLLVLLLSILSAFYYLRVMQQAYFRLNFNFTASLLFNVLDQVTLPNFLLSVSLAAMSLFLVGFALEPQLLYLYTHSLSTLLLS